MIPFFSPTSDPEPEAVLDCLVDNGLPRDPALIVEVAADGYAERDEDGWVWPFAIMLTKRGAWLLGDQEDHR